MPSETLARRLVRLYPRRWRERYETEMLALIDDTGLDARRSFDVAWGAGREWVRTVVEAPSPVAVWIVWMLVFPAALACGIAFLGTLVAQWLTIHVPTPAIVWLEDGHKVVAPPQLPGRLAAFGPILQFVVIARVVAARGFFQGGWKVGRAEAVLWFLALFTGSIFRQWFDMVLWYETGIPSQAASEIWFYSASSLWNSSMFLIYSTRFVANHVEQRRLSREAAKAARHSSVPRGPLGLA